MLAQVTLEVMVPLRIEHLEQLRGETLLEQLYEWVDYEGRVYDEAGRLIPWAEEMVAGSLPGEKPRDAGLGLQLCAEGLAALAWVADGGVDWAGMHWCRRHRAAAVCRGRSRLSSAGRSTATATSTTPCGSGRRPCPCGCASCALTAAADGRANTNDRRVSKREPAADPADPGAH